ncbi:hypothetical protein WJX81_001472 [Elliptochloris bilobata]|uniref:Uncharacterized protein n=1 Tax=Elliptochloris bilobata TaxID=381761 RepID=A0AAW1S3T0_9CHLO
MRLWSIKYSPRGASRCEGTASHNRAVPVMMVDRRGLSSLERTGRRLLQLVYADQPPAFGPLGQPGNWGGTLYFPLAQRPADPNAAAKGTGAVLTDPYVAALAAAAASGPVSRRRLAAAAPVLPRRLGLWLGRAGATRRLLQEPALIGAGGQHFGAIAGAVPATPGPTLAPLGATPVPAPGVPTPPVTPPPTPVTPPPTPAATPAPATPAPAAVSNAAAARPDATTKPEPKAATVIVPVDAFQPAN